MNHNLMKQIHTNLSLTESIILCEDDIDFIYSSETNVYMLGRNTDVYSNVNKSFMHIRTESAFDEQKAVSRNLYDITAYRVCAKGTYAFAARIFGIS